MRFNEQSVIKGGALASEPSQELIEATPNLRQASLTDAALYGGPLVRRALDALKLDMQHEHVIVDTKVNFLMRGMVPAIPGWHTDGVPRKSAESEPNPASSGAPVPSLMDSGDISAPTYHLLWAGADAPTEFVDAPFAMNTYNLGHPDLYSDMDKLVGGLIKDARLGSTEIERHRWHRWGWKSVHRATPAKERGWRFLIRVTETDHIEPRVGPSEFLRTSSAVYVERSFGW